VETNFLFGVFRMPSERHRDALELVARWHAREIKLYVPYLCLQEARHLIATSLRASTNWCSDLFEFHRFATTAGTATWDFEEIRKLLDSARGEVSRTKAAYQREMASFASALGEGVLHGTKEVFDVLEALQLDDDLEYNDKLILSSVLVKAKELRGGGVQGSYFASTDKDFRPTADRPKMTTYYAEAGLTFVPGFVLPDAPATPA
jgi:predicted nucleic acid-binding protein